MDQIRWGRGRWLIGGALVAGLLVGVAYGQTTGGQGPPGATPSAPPATQTSSPDKVVMKVGDTSVTQGEMERFIQTLNPQAQRNLATQGRRGLGDEYALMLVLSQEALSHHLDSTPAFKELSALRRLQLLATMQYQQVLQQSVVTPEETNTYFNAHQSDFEEIQVLQVLVRKKPEGSKEGTPGFTAEEAKTRVEEIRKAFIAGDDPKKVAQQYQLESVVRVDSQPYTVRRGSMREDMEKAAFKLKPGEVTDVFDLGQALAFVKVVSHKEADLKTVSPQIENTLRQQKITAALDELKKNAKVWLDDAYFTAPTPPRKPVKPEGEVSIPATPK